MKTRAAENPEQDCVLEIRELRTDHTTSEENLNVVSFCNADKGKTENDIKKNDKTYCP